jgi:hypothetical protein
MVAFFEIFLDARSFGCPKELYLCNKIIFYQILSKMTYLVQLLDPRAQALLDALVQMSMVQLTPVADSTAPNVTKTKRLAAIAESLREVKAHRKGEIQLQTLNEFLKELD